MGRPRIPLHIRLSKQFVIANDGCWNWSGFTARGYGYFSYHPGEYRAKSVWVQSYKLMYELIKGKIPEGHQLDHLCRNRKCINPSYLEPVTCRENLMRSQQTKAAQNAAKTHCKHGHELSPANIYVWHKRPNSRNCRICRGMKLLTNLQ